MTPRLRILLIEDSPDDAALIEAHLAEAGYQADWHRVDTLQALDAALAQGGWDLLISDFDLPGFTALDVLRFVRASDLDVPRIVVSGVLSEDAAVAVMKAGAHDFISKERLSRLVPAIERELAEAANRAKHRRTQAMLDAQAGLLRDMIAALGEGVMVLDVNGYLMMMNPEAERLLGWSADELRLRKVHDTIHFRRPDGSLFPAQDCPLVQVAKSGVVHRCDGDEVFVRKDGEIFPVAYVATPIFQGGEIFASVTAFRDITKRTAAEAELRESREQLRKLSAYLNSVREEERTHIARELHDELGQMLTAMKMDVSWLRARLAERQPELLGKVEAMAGLLDDTVDSVRRIAASLRPRLLDDLGLGPAIEWLVDGFRKRTGIACTLTTSHEDFAVDAERATAVFRILQESLTNITRHAEASAVEVALVQDVAGVTLVVRDNGKGMDVIRAGQGKSFGLLGLKERARSLDGEARIESRPGQGTRLEVFIPVPATAGVAA